MEGDRNDLFPVLKSKNSLGISKKVTFIIEKKA